MCVSVVRGKRAVEINQRALFLSPSPCSPKHQHQQHPTQQQHIKDTAKALWVTSLALPDCQVRYSAGRPKGGAGNGKSANMNWALTRHIYPRYPDADVPNHHVLAFLDADQVRVLLLCVCA